MENPNNAARHADDEATHQVDVDDAFDEVEERRKIDELAKQIDPKLLARFIKSLRPQQEDLERIDPDF